MYVGMYAAFSHSIRMECLTTSVQNYRPTIRIIVTVQLVDWSWDSEVLHNVGWYMYFDIPIYHNKIFYTSCMFITGISYTIYRYSQTTPMYMYVHVPQVLKRLFLKSGHRKGVSSILKWLICCLKHFFDLCCHASLIYNLSCNIEYWYYKNQYRPTLVHTIIIVTKSRVVLGHNMLIFLTLSIFLIYVVTPIWYNINIIYRDIFNIEYRCYKNQYRPTLVQTIIIVTKSRVVLGHTYSSPTW